MFERLLGLLSNKSIDIPKTIDMPTELIGNTEMDSCLVYMGIFEKGDKEPYIIYSAGIGDQINFELDLLKILKEKGIRAELYAIDPTPKSLEFLATQDLPDNFHVLPYALSGKNETLHFALPQTEGWVSGSCANVKNDERCLDFKNTISVEGRTITSIMKELNHERIDLLKMDIEGSEFDVLENSLNACIQIDEMCIDFHDYMIKDGQKRLKNVLDLLLKNYDVFNFQKTYHAVGCISKYIEMKEKA